jgi:hypothetical protein
MAFIPPAAFSIYVKLSSLSKSHKRVKYLLHKLQGGVPKLWVVNGVRRQGEAPLRGFGRGLTPDTHYFGTGVRGKFPIDPAPPINYNPVQLSEMPRGPRRTTHV